jgi:hypothetical protein
VKVYEWIGRRKEDWYVEYVLVFGEVIVAVTFRGDFTAESGVTDAFYASQPHAWKMVYP